MRRKTAIVDSIEFEESSGNVFADLGLPDAELLQLKSAISLEIFRILERRKLTQQKAAELLGVKQPEVSRLKQGKFSHYSLERLFTFLNRLDRDVEVHIRRSANKEAHQRVIAL